MGYVYPIIVLTFLGAGVGWFSSHSIFEYCIYCVVLYGVYLESMYPIKRNKIKNQQHYS